MREHPDTASGDATERLGFLTQEYGIRILNFSPAGCLLESDVRIPVGTVGSLGVTINGQEREDDVRVVRCQRIPGAGSRYHVGVQFLWTTPPGVRTLRRAFMHDSQPDFSQIGR